MGITELLYNVWLLFYVMQFMSTAYLIQFVGSHYFRQFMSLSDYWILMQLNVLDTMYVLQFMCIAVFGGLCVLRLMLQFMCISNLIG